MSTIIDIQTKQEDAATTIQRATDVFFSLRAPVFVWRQVVDAAKAPSLSREWLNGLATSQGFSWQVGNEKADCGLVFTTDKGEKVLLHHTVSGGVGCTISIDEEGHFPFKLYKILTSISCCGFAHVSIRNRWNPVRRFTDKDELVEHLRQTIREEIAQTEWKHGALKSLMARLD